MPNIKKFLGERLMTNGNEYEFLRENVNLNGRILFLAFGGSHAYGTSVPTSDVDIRGCALNSTRNILLGKDFEQVQDSATDTVVYSFNKLVNLLCACNPNCIELLGCKPKHYVVMHAVGQEMIDNRKMFLSRRAINSFGGYANSQLRRLQCAVARDALAQSDKEIHMMNSMKNAMMSFETRYTEFPEGSIRLHTDKSTKEDMDTEIFMNITLKDYPLRDFSSICSEFNEVLKIYGKLNHRNNKKTEQGLNKHAMHLVRLYLMALDILEKEEINTHREADLPLLMSIRNGEYANEDGTYRSEFFEMVDEYEKRLKYAAENSSLPQHPDMEAIGDFVEYANKRVVLDSANKFSDYKLYDILTELQKEGA